MFKEKIIKEFEAIKPSEQTENAVLLKMEQEQEKQISVSPKKPAKKRWIAAIAAVLALVIISITVFNMPIFDGSNYIFTGSKDNNNLETSSNNTASTDNMVSKEDYSSSSGETSSKKTEQYNKIKFPDIKYKNGAPTNISHTQTYQLFEAIYETEQQHKKHSSSGTNSTMGFKGDSNSNNYGNPSSNYTKTNIQVEGVDEADLVKTNGKYIYTCNTYDDILIISEVNNGKIKKASEIELENTAYAYRYNSPNLEGIYVSGNRLVIISEYSIYSEKTHMYNYNVAVKLYDVSDPFYPVHINDFVQSGGYMSSRLIGNNLYVFTNETLYGSKLNVMKKSDITQYLPCVATGDADLKPISEKNLFIFDGEVNTSYFMATSIDINAGKRIDSKGVIGGGDEVYVNSTSIYAVSGRVTYSNNSKSYTPKTHIIKLTISKGKITPLAKGEVKGTVLNQFSMDEHNGYFRIVTTVRKYKLATCCNVITSSGIDYNAVYVLDKNLKTVGSITGIAKEESVYSVRFIGNMGYFVTYRQVDPLFAVDLSNPKAPKILSALKVPGFSDYLHPWGEDVLIGVGSMGVTNTLSDNAKISIFDIRNPADVKEISNVEVPHSYPRIGEDHKAIFVSEEKNLIGFAGDSVYYLYYIDDKYGLSRKEAFVMPTGETNTANLTICTRGIFIGDYFYVCNLNGIISYKYSENSIGKKINRISF